ncbi:TRPT1 [Bugula neritina]|uniref:2'-phosphotransferase n=1 Tax=Bugula neritina TaxID=10212 RepID=A0A7J7JU09_BUGNE|nr:TRPT1 [Bugula neritina]
MASGSPLKPNKSGPTHNVKLSKLLSYILRHGAEKEGLHMLPSGYVKVEDLLKHPKFKGYNLDNIRLVVQNNSKQRFQLNEDGAEVLIRANQGHSIDVPDLELTKLEPGEIEFAIHGTYEKCVSSIKEKGLSRMRRQHIHMVVDELQPGKVVSGARQSCDYVVRINVAKAQKDGLEFFKSKNNVILCPGDENGVILPKYFYSIHPRIF